MTIFEFIHLHQNLKLFPVNPETRLSLQLALQDICFISPDQFIKLALTSDH